MSDTKKSNEKYKLERKWQELQSDKRKYIERLQEEEEAKEQLLNWQKYMNKERND